MDLSLKEQLLQISDELQSIAKQILQNLFTENKKESNEKGANEKLHALLESFNQNQSEFVNLLKKVPEAQERARYVKTLEASIESRDNLIGKLANEIKSIESSVMEATYQAEKKLKSVKQSELNRVFSEDVIRFAHQISKHHSVSSSVYWQQGDPSRPYPTEENFAVSSLLLSRTQPNIPHPFISQGPAGGIMPNSLKSAAMFNVPGMPQKAFSPSPRSAMFGAAMGASTSASPRGRPPGTGARMASPSARPKILQRSASQQSPRFPQLTMPGQQIASSSPSASPMAVSFIPGQQSQQMLINFPSNIKQFSQISAPDVQKVEQMSSESSSSSSSGDEAS